MSALTHSRLFQGTVRHRRRGEKEHAFRYDLGLVLIDLAELPRLVDALPWRGLGWGPRAYRRADYLDAENPCLDTAVRLRVEAELGFRPDGAVRMLTQLRTFGYLFNPVSFYLCHDAEGGMAAVVAEITNTPWGERHAYVLDARDTARATTHRWSFRKVFHVSPFHGMRQTYHWALNLSGDRLAVSMWNEQDGKRVFDATLAGRLRPLTKRAMALDALRRPLQSQRLHLAIYWQAARLFLKRVRFHPHPRKLAGAAGKPAPTDHVRIPHS